MPACLRSWAANRASLAGEVRRSTCLGCTGCTIATLAAGGTLPLLPLALVSGGAAGALIGLLLWCGSSDQHEDTVVPPRSPRC